MWKKSNQDDKMWLQPFTDVSNQNDLSVECNTCVYAVSLFVSSEAGSHSQFPPSSPKREGRTSPFLNENIDAWNNELCWPDQLHLNPTLTSTAFSLTCFWDYRYVDINWSSSCLNLQLRCGNRLHTMNTVLITSSFQTKWTTCLLCLVNRRIIHCGRLSTASIF